MHAEEPLLEQLLVRELARLEDDTHRFGMSGVAAAHVLVIRRLRRAAGVADFGADHAGDLAQDLFHAPEASAREYRDLQAGLTAGALTGSRLAARVLGIGGRSQQRGSGLAAGGEEVLVLRVSLARQLGGGNEAKRRRVDAVARPRRRRTVVEQMPEVCLSAARQHFGADHTVTRVGGGDHPLGLDRPRKARPAGAGVELVGRAEQRLAARHIDVQAGFVIVPVLVVERRLGGGVLRDLVCDRRQPLAQLGIRRLRIDASGSTAGRSPGTRRRRLDGRRVHANLRLAATGYEQQHRRDAEEQTSNANTALQIVHDPRRRVYAPLYRETRRG